MSHIGKIVKLKADGEPVWEIIDKRPSQYQGYDNSEIESCPYVGRCVIGGEYHQVGEISRLTFAGLNPWVNLWVVLSEQEVKTIKLEQL